MMEIRTKVWSHLPVRPTRSQPTSWKHYLQAGEGLLWCVYSRFSSRAHQQKNRTAIKTFANRVSPKYGLNGGVRFSLLSPTLVKLEVGANAWTPHMSKSSGVQACTPCGLRKEEGSLLLPCSGSLAHIAHTGCYVQHTYTDHTVGVGIIPQHCCPSF